MYLLGIDIGTSSCKVAVFTENGEAVAQATKMGRFCVIPQSGWTHERRKYVKI